jgi:serine/threonine protein kinase
MYSCGPYNLYSEIGRGAWGSVFLAENTENGRIYAIKVIDPNYEASALDIGLISEADLLKKMSHPNIAKLEEYNEGAEIVDNRTGDSGIRFVMAMELWEGGDLFNYISEVGRFEEHFARYFFHQLWEALSHMQQNGIYHRDLKIENLMLDADFNLKLIDFGFGTIKSKCQTILGTPEYMAPEITEKSQDGYWAPAVDMFSLGVILFIMVWAKQPFSKASAIDYFYKHISNNRPDLFWSEHANDANIEELSCEVIDLITSLLSKDPVHRLTLSEVISHPWYQEKVPAHILVHEECSRRKEKINGDNVQTDFESEVYTVDPNVFSNNSVSRGFGSKKETDSIIIDRKVQQYHEKCGILTQFFSTTDIKILFDHLAKFVSHKTSEYSFNKEDYSSTFSFVDDSSNAVQVNVKILKVSEEEKYCVQAIKLDGNNFAFHKVYRQLREFYGGHANATHST